jgi:glycosyltransferase involved in cell wall biosynthesis
MALEAQELASQAWEVIVVDDGLCEETRRRVESRAARSRISIRYERPVERHGPAAARNAGWLAARGWIIAFTDDDCVPDPRWLAEGLASFQTPDVAAVAGRVVVPIPERPTDYERDAAGLACAEFVTANCFIRREVLELIGGFDERYAVAWREDSDLQFTLLERGLRIVRSPEAVVVHPVRPAPWGVCLRQQRKSQFNALLYKKFPSRYRARIQPSPPWGYYATVAAVVLAVVASFAGAYVVAAAAIACWTMLTARFLARRLRRNSTAPGHVAEMALTSAIIPPLAVFWRLYGAMKFRVLFM